MEKITLETVFTPYTLDTYQTFTFENDEECLIDEGKTYDDYEWDYDCKGYLNDLAENLIVLLRDNILDDVITGINSDLKVSSPKQYNFDTDKIFIDFKVDQLKLDKYINDNIDEYNKNKLKSCDGFMWFGDDKETKLNYYLRKVSAEKYSQESYFYDQIDCVQGCEYITNKLIKK